MYTDLKNAFNSISPIADDDWLMIKPLLKVKEYKKNDYYLNAGEIEMQIGFISKGWFRWYYINSKGDEVNFHFHKNRKPQSFMQFLVWGFPEMKHGNLLEKNFCDWATHSQRKNLGSIKRPGINLILGDPRLQFVRKKIRQAIADVATSVYNTGIIPKDKRAIIENSDHISVRDFHFFATKYWIKRFKTDYWNL